MIKTLKYCLYPTERQVTALNDTLWLCSLLYNQCLAERKDCWELGGHNVSKYDQMNRLPELKKLDQRFSGVNAQVLQDVVKRLGKTYEAFFRRVRKGEKAGYPRFKPARRYDSFTYPQAPSGCELKGNRLNLSKIGSVRIKLHRPIEGKIKTCTIKRYADGWYALFACEVEPKILPASERCVGVDLGLESFAITSDGEFFPSQKYLKKAERNIKRLHRQMDRRKKGSNRRKKAVQQLGKAYLHVADQRKDNAHKVARSLVNRYGTIAVEDLQVVNMVKNHYLAGAISDAGWSIFTRILSSKAEEAGRQVIKVDPKYTSQICSQCGALVPKPLSQRWHSCPHCGLELHRDVNAAINIQRRGAA
jgi:putative transposase